MEGSEWFSPHSYPEELIRSLCSEAARDPQAAEVIPRNYSEPAQV